MKSSLGKEGNRSGNFLPSKHLRLRIPAMALPGTVPSRLLGCQIRDFRGSRWSIEPMIRSYLERTVESFDCRWVLGWIEKETDS